MIDSSPNTAEDEEGDVCFLLLNTFRILFVKRAIIELYLVGFLVLPLTIGRCFFL